MDAHVDIQQQFAPAAEKAGYWKEPQVWADLHSAFERFFELNHGDIGWYHDYARYAWRAGDWATLNKLIPKLGPVNYEFFGGEEKFNEMVAEAKTRAWENKAKN